MRELLAEVSMHDARAAPHKRWEHEAVLDAMQERLDRAANSSKRSRAKSQQ
jgi:hypothetical protein